MSLLALLASCSRQHKDSDFLPTAPEVRGALVLVFSAQSIPADGLSTAEIVAQIDPLSDFRKVEFLTDKGSFLDPDSSNPKKKVTEADIDGKATVQLKSETAAGIATVTVSVKGPSAADASREETKVSVTGTVEFARLDPDVLTFTIEGDSLAADGFSFLDLLAHVDPALPKEYRKIQFEATAPGIIRGGEPSSGTGTSIKKVTADADGNARAQLTSPTSQPKTGPSNVTARLEMFPEVLKTFVVEFKPFAPGSIELSTSADSIPADGFSTVELLAVIDPETPPDFRGIRFRATDGRLNNTVAAGTELEVQADVNGEARVQLTSSTNIGPVEVKASLASDTSVFAVKFVEFTAPNSGDIIRLSTASSSVPADGVTTTTVTAEVTPELGQQTVAFTTSLGTLAPTSQKTTDGRASVTIKSDTMGTAALTAEVAGFVADATLSFGRAFPDSIEVIAGAFELSEGAKTREIRVKLRRSPGKVSEGTIVDYEIVREADGTEITDMAFRSIKASNSAQESSAELVVEGSVFRGLAIVRATVTGSGAPPGEDTIKIVD